MGLGRSGLACAQILHNLKAEVEVTDNQDNPAIRQALAQLQERGIKVEVGRHSQDSLKDKDLVVISPGVDARCPILSWAEELGVPIISEIELGWLLCSGTIIAITGSSGKTTVTTLLGEVFRSAKRNVFVLGNIGTPLTSQVDQINDGDIVCLEVSSFQLERTMGFRPKVAVMLNFNRNHLDRHRDMQEYLEAKKKIFANQDESDYLVLNAEDPVLSGLKDEASSKAVFFRSTRKYNPNQAAVVATAGLFGISQTHCDSVFAGFKGIEHRLEYVSEVAGVTFINDSKSTLVESTVWAIKNISQPIILIAGGRDKGLDYSGIVEVAKKKVKEVILIGEARDKIRQAIKSDFSVTDASNLSEAVWIAFQKAKSGECVLLSPMCASFDMFSDYEERGRVFKDIVREISQKVYEPQS